MSLVEFIKASGGTKTFYHVIRESIGDIRLQYQIGNKDENFNKRITEEVQKTVFQRNNPEIFVFHTSPMPYIEAKGNDEVIDIAVLSLSENEGRKQFVYELGESKRIRGKMMNDLEKELMPFLEGLKPKEEIGAIILRGDLVDPERFPNKFSDIDISLITNFWHYETDGKNELIEFLKRSPGTVLYIYWEYDFERPNFYGDGQFLSENKGDFTVFYDIMSLPSMIKLSNSLRFSDVPYFRRNYSFAKTIYSCGNTSKRFIRLMTGLGEL